MVGPSMDPSMKIAQTDLQVVFVPFPCDPIDPWGGFMLKAIEAVPQEIHGYMV